MELTAADTAIVLDSTADFPDGPKRFANWRIVPLYVRFGEETFRDYEELGPDEFYKRLRGAGELPSTSHLSIIDARGNAVSFTTTIENGFGSRLMTEGGFLLNNELTDFSFAALDGGKPVANRVEGGKR